MLADHIHYRGAYRFTDRATLERALVSARRTLDAPTAEAWLRSFNRRGSALQIDLGLPARSDRRGAAARVMQTFASLAVEGIVVARQRDLAIDVFVCGLDHGQ